MWHPDPDQLALAALPAEDDDPRVEDHLRDCPLCRGHVESLRRTVDLAVAGRSDGTEYGDPPDRIWTAITGELDLAEQRPWWRRVAVPAAAAAATLLIGLGAGYLAGSAAPAERPLAVLAGVDPAEAGATGTAAVTVQDGQQVVVVRADGVTPPPGTDYLESWLMDPTGTRVISLGALAPDGDGWRGTFTLPAGLPMAAFDRIDVSAERWDGDEQHSQESLLRGPLS